MIRLVLIAALLAMSNVALACPVCASGQSRSSWVETALVAGMIAAPIVIAGLVFRWLRRALRAVEQGAPR